MNNQTLCDILVLHGCRVEGLDTDLHYNMELKEITGYITIGNTEYTITMYLDQHKDDGYFWPMGIGIDVMDEEISSGPFIEFTDSETICRAWAEMLVKFWPEYHIPEFELMSEDPIPYNGPTLESAICYACNDTPFNCKNGFSLGGQICHKHDGVNYTVITSNGETAINSKIGLVLESLLSLQC